MQILIAAHGFPPTHSAGAERRAERMARWLASQGHHIEVFAVESFETQGFEVKTTTENGYTVHRLFYDLEDGDTFTNYYDNPRIAQALESILSQRQFDLVHLISGYLMGGQLVHTAQAHHLPVVITLTEFWFLCTQLNLMQPSGDLCSGPETDLKCARCISEDRRRFRVPAQRAPLLMDAFWSAAKHLPLATSTTAAIAQRRQTLKTALDAVDLVICPSQFLIDKFAEYDFDTSSYTFMRQGLNVPDSLPSKIEDPSTLRLLYIGQIQYHKGVDLLIDAAIQLLNQGRAVTLDLWGSETQSPAYTADLKARTAAYPSIHWNGRYTGPKVWELLSEADALVIPVALVRKQPQRDP